MNDVFRMEMLEGDEDLCDEELGDALGEAALLAGQDHLQHVACRIKWSAIKYVRQM